MERNYITLSKDADVLDIAYSYASWIADNINRDMAGQQIRYTDINNYIERLFDAIRNNDLYRDRVIHNYRFRFKVGDMNYSLEKALRILKDEIMRMLVINNLYDNIE